MNYIIILLAYLLTVITTFTIRGINLYLLISDLATECSKIDIDEMYKNREIEEFNFKRINFESFIPIYNVIKSIMGLVEYNYYCGPIIDDLEKIMVVCPMASFEKYEYLQKPTIPNLYKVLIKGYKRLSKAHYFEVIDDDGFKRGKVRYEGNQDINILNTSGIFTKMSRSEIIDVIQNNNSTHVFGNYSFDNGETKGLVTKNEVIKKKIDEMETMSRLSKISQLEELRDYLLLMKEERQIKAKQKKLGKKEK